MSSREPEHRDDEKEPFFLSMLPFAGLALLLVLALLWHYIPQRAPEASEEPDYGALAVQQFERLMPREIPFDAERDFTLGREDAPITLVEFSDFECPYCRTAAEEVRALLQSYGDDVRLVFKNLPLDIACNDQMSQQLHPFACRAAVVARCAGEQRDELFWKTHDALYRASHLSEATLEAAAREAGADLEKLEACVAAGDALEAVKADIDEAHTLGVSGTPTFYLNGRKVADYRNGALESLAEHVLRGASDP